ncbi:MAG: hypothetical protein MR550_00365 [Bacilli bacterium]|nr:hypothetical protein [Bacilli bacterium]
MKKIKYLIVALFLILLTGCSSYDMSMSINKNKSMDLSINIVSTSKEEISKYVDSLKEKYEVNDFKVEEFTRDNNYGIRITKHYDNIDNNSFAERTDKFDLLYLYNNDYDKSIETKIFNVDKGFASNRYAANFFVDLTNIDIDLSNTEVTFVAYLPKGNVSNNASSVSEDGNTLTWNITNKGRTDIEFVFELGSYDTIYFIVAIFIAIFLVFSIISAILSKSGDASSSYVDRDIEILSNNAKYYNMNKNKPSGNGVYSNYMNNRNNNSNNNVKKPELVKFNNNENDFNKMMGNVSIVNNNISNNNDIFNYPTNDNNLMNNNINNNPNLNINKSVDVVNSFNYEEPVDNKEVVEEINNYDPDIIRVNNKDVVVTKEKKEDE